MEIGIHNSATTYGVSADVATVVYFQSRSCDMDDPWERRGCALLRELCNQGEFTGELYDSVLIHRPQGINAPRLLLVGGGERDLYSTVRARRLTGTVVRCAMDKRLYRIAFYVGHRDMADPSLLQAFVEGAILGSWLPGKYKTQQADIWSEKGSFFLHCPVEPSDEARAAVARGRILAQAQNEARELVSEPPNRQSPADLVSAAEALSTRGISIKILDRKQISELGMGGLLGVAQGSANSPFLASLHYEPNTGSDGVHLAFIGKGVTFDSGGNSLKAAGDMAEMKYDMAGAATVIAAMNAIGQLRPNVRITGYIGAVENMIGGNAQRPGDIVTTLSGKTVEVVNTDAEGRLVLADVITYARNEGATHIVDIATLTDAVDVALGRKYAAVFTNNSEFLVAFSQCAQLAGEETWQLPLHEDYAAALQSSCADLKNFAGRPAGAIMAAGFLQIFADPTPWIHLDIAATAWLDDDKPWSAPGPTGIGVRSFVRFALEWPERVNGA